MAVCGSGLDAAVGLAEQEAGEASRGGSGRQDHTIGTATNDLSSRR